MSALRTGRAPLTESRDPEHRGRARRSVPFVYHEVAEYVVAAALLAVGIHVSGGTQLLLLTVGAAMFVLGALTSGRLGAVELISRRVHHLGDLVLAGLLALSPAVLYHHLHLAGSVAAEAVALVLLRIERSTRYIDPPRSRPGRSVPSVPVPSATTLTGRETPRADQLARSGAAAGAAAASVVTVASQLAPVAGRVARLGARRLGVAAGTAKRAARGQRGDRSRGRA